MDVMGVWVIDEINYKSQNIKIYLLANAMTIRKNDSCEVPIIEVEDNHTDKQKGRWKIEEKEGKSYLNIATSNKLFNTSFLIEKIWKEHDNESQGEFLKMILSSDNLTLQCTRDASDIPF